MSNSNNPENRAAAENHVKTMVGPTILFGDGMFFDFSAPDASEMTIEDYAWGLVGNNRFRNQTRLLNGDRCLYNVLQHVILMAHQMLADGLPMRACYNGLMHESDEVPWGDFPGPAKRLMPAEFVALVKMNGDAIDRRFDVTDEYKDVVKRYDIRMLATEKRDLMPHSSDHKWEYAGGYEPFDFIVNPWSIESCIDQFLDIYSLLRKTL